MKFDIGYQRSQGLAVSAITVFETTLLYRVFELCESGLSIEPRD